MPANSGLPDQPQRISVVCDCGKKLVATSMQSGKRAKCPSCGQVIVIPPVPAGIIPAPASAAAKPRPKTGKRRLLGVLLMMVVCLLPIVAAIGAGALILSDLRSRRQEAANTEVRDAVKRAEDWLKQGGAKEGENVQHRLMNAIAAEDASEKGKAGAVLETVRTRRAELAADTILDSAKTKLDGKAIVDAVALLRRYVADPHATKKLEAEQLLTDCELATSDSAAMKMLVSLSNEQFDQFTRSGKLGGRQIAHPILVEMCATTLGRNLERAKENRKSPQDVEREKRQLAWERARQAEAREAKAQSAKLDEQDAAYRLEYAQGTFRDAADAHNLPDYRRGRVAAGFRQLREVVERWPSTKAAVQAKQILDSLKMDPDSKVAEQAKQTLDSMMDPVSLAIRTFTDSRMPARRREQAVDRLQALGPAALPAVPVLAEAALDEGENDEYVKRKAIEILGEIGGMQGVLATGRVLLMEDKSGYLGFQLSPMVDWQEQISGFQNDSPAEKAGLKEGDVVVKIQDKPITRVADLIGIVNFRRDRSRRGADICSVEQMPETKPGDKVSVTVKRDDMEKTFTIKLGTKPNEIVKAAEDSLLKLLPAVGNRLTMGDAIFLMKVHQAGNKRVSPAIESAWAASGITRDAIVTEINKPALARQAAIDKAIAKAMANAPLEAEWKNFFAALPPDTQARINPILAKLHTEEEDRKFKKVFMSQSPAWQEWILQTAGRSERDWVWDRVYQVWRAKYKPLSEEEKWRQIRKAQAEREEARTKWRIMSEQERQFYMRGGGHPPP